MPASRKYLQNILKTTISLFVLYATFEIFSSNKPPSTIRLDGTVSNILQRRLAAVAEETVGYINIIPSLQRHFLAPVNSQRLKNAQVLQDYLICAVNSGMFVLQNTKMRSHGRSLNALYRWIPDNNCQKTLENASSPVGNKQHPVIRASYSNIDICHFLRGKRLVLLGDRLQYSLHDLIVHRLSFDHACVGAEFCNWHRICPISSEPSFTSTTFSSNGTLSDADLIIDPDSYSFSATRNHGLMRYAQSTSLLPIAKRSDRRLNDPYMSIATDVREHESYWKFWISGSDIIVLSRGPVSAPAWSYTIDHPTNVDHSRFEHRQLGIDKEFTTILQNISLPSMPSWHSGPGRNVLGDGYNLDEITSAAVRATLEIWLPSVFRTLVSVRDNAWDEKIFVWRGEWYAQKFCQESGFPTGSVDTAELLGIKGAGKSGSLSDPWLTYRNIQGLLLTYHIFYALPSFRTNLAS